MSTMTISKKGLELIKSFESFVPIPYKCSAGKLTIGYGHVIKTGESFAKMTLDIADELLKKDCKIAENCINNNVVCDLNQDQFDALVSFIFNVGCGAFLNSTLLKLLNKKEYVWAAEEFLKWNKATVKDKLTVLAGLTRRREAERLLFLSQ